MSHTRKPLIITSLALGATPAALDLVITGTGVPPAFSSFGGSLLFSWTSSTYLLSSTITVPLYGRLADLYGRKPIYLFGTLLFMFGSLLCSLAVQSQQMIVFRAIQGLGAGAIVPVAMTIIADTFSGQQRAKVQALFGSLLGAATVLGPVVGLVLAQGFGWQSIFLVNIPLGLASVMLLGVGIQEKTARPSRKAVDYPGAITFAVGIALLLSTIQNAATTADWISLENAGMLALSAVALGLFAMIEASTKEAMLPISFLLSNRTIRASSAAALLIGTAMLAVLAYSPLFLEGIMSGPTAARDALIGLGLGWVVGSAADGYVHVRLGCRRAVLLGTTMIFLGSLMLTLLGTSTTTTAAGAAMVAMGLGLGFSTTSLLIAVQNSVAISQQGLATSSVHFFRTMGGIVGVSVLGVLLNSQLAGNLTAALGDTPFERVLSVTNFGLHLAPALEIGVPGTMRETLASALQTVFWGILGFAVLSLAASFSLPAKDANAKDSAAMEQADQPHVEKT